MNKNIILTSEQRKKLKIEDNRIDFYFKVENALVDNYMLFDNIYEAYLYVILCRFCNNNGVAFPSYNTLAKYCHCSRMTVINNIKSLEKKGLINKVSRLMIGNKNADTNIYTVNNLRQYKISGTSDILPVVNEIDHPSISDIPKKEIVKNKNIINTTIYKEKKESSSYDFLDKNIFNLVNSATKKNIRKNIKDLTEEKFTKIYNLALEELKSGKINNFNAVIYSALNNQWEFEKIKNDNKELDTNKKKWLSYFSGIATNYELKKEIENIIVTIPFDILQKNKSKLSKMNIFDFKSCLYQLKKQNIAQ